MRTAPVRPPGTKDSAATRNALIAAGVELFAERGFDGTTTEAVARRAAVNKAMISYHFGGKAGLYAAILEEHFIALANRLGELARSELPPDALLRQLLGALGEMQARRPALPTMMLREVLSGGSHLSEHVLAALVSVFGFVRELLDRGVRTGTFRQVDPLLTHLVLLGSVLFFFSSEPFRRRLIAERRVPVKRPPTPEEFLAHLGDLMSHALSRDSAPHRPRRSRRGNRA
jgi:AcrR family transcriptional regulator